MLHETLDHDLLEKSQNLLPFESDNTITYRLSLHFQCVPMWQDVVRLIKEFGILLLVKVKIHTLAFANREGPLMVFHKGLINSNYWTTIVANLVSFSILRFHIGFLKCFHVPFIQDLCLCIGFKKVLIFLYLPTLSNLFNEYTWVSFLPTCPRPRSSRSQHLEHWKIGEKKSFKVFQLLMLLQSDVPHLPLHGGQLWTTY